MTRRLEIKPLNIVKYIPSCLLYSFARVSMEDSTSASEISCRSRISSSSSSASGPREWLYLRNTCFFCLVRTSDSTSRGQTLIIIRWRESDMGPGYGTVNALHDHSCHAHLSVTLAVVIMFPSLDVDIRPGLGLGIFEIGTIYCENIGSSH
jgi:hypothetical protein